MSSSQWLNNFYAAIACAVQRGNQRILDAAWVKMKKQQEELQPQS